MLYAGATIDLDASALNNQGSIVAAQMPLASQRYNMSYVNGIVTLVQPHVDDYGYRVNFPGQSISQMPGAYMGLAQDGIYMPIKLDPEAPWVTTANMPMIAPASDTAAPDYTYTTLRQHGLPTVSAFAGSAFPFYGPDGLAAPIEPAYSPAPSAGMLGDVTIPFQQTNTGLICFYNMSLGARLTVKLKWGIEGRVFPTSVLAPAMQPSAMVDQQALEAYSDLAATLPWAFPSSYNSWDEIVGVLKQAWNTLKPAATAALIGSGHPFGVAAGGLLSVMPEAKITKKQRFERPPGSSKVQAQEARNNNRAQNQRKQGKQQANKKKEKAAALRDLDAILARYA
jgi:hypothetical protein